MSTREPLQNEICDGCKLAQMTILPVSEDWCVMLDVVVGFCFAVCKVSHSTNV